MGSGVFRTHTWRVEDFKQNEGKMSYFSVQAHGTELNLWIAESNIQSKEVRTKYIKIFYSQDLDNKFPEHKFRKMDNIFYNGLLWLGLALFQYTFTRSSSFPIHFSWI